jgi:hypothetical protein
MDEVEFALAVLRLVTRSNRSGRCIGKSLGLAPRRIFATLEMPHRLYHFSGVVWLWNEYASWRIAEAVKREMQALLPR